jgi:hypothetical protein
VKKVECILFLCLLVSSFTAFAEDDSKKSDKTFKTFSITVYPVMAPFGWYSGEAELAFSRHFSLAFEAKYSNNTERFSMVDDGQYKTRYFEAGFGLRFYPLIPSDALDGFFIGVYADWSCVRELDRQKDETNRYKGYSATGWIGSKRSLGPVIFETSIGFGYSKNGYSNQRHNEGDFVFRGVGLGIGIGF